MAVAMMTSNLDKKHRKHYILCHYGASRNKPFCDGLKTKSKSTLKVIKTEYYKVIKIYDQLRNALLSP